MAFDPKPSTWIPSWSEDGTNITVPIASFPQMTAAEADATTGDIRKVVFAICDELQAYWDTLSTADKPTKMVLSKSASINSTTGIITYQYTMRFEAEILTQDVADE